MAIIDLENRASGSLIEFGQFRPVFLIVSKIRFVDTNAAISTCSDRIEFVERVSFTGIDPRLM